MTKREGLIAGIFLFLLLICSTSSFAKMPQIDINDWVSISGDIDTGKADEVILALMNLDSKPGTAPIGIRITSPGGSLTAVMAICDVIKSLRHPVVTVALGEATSGAGLILSCGDKRYVGEHTIVMLHQPAIVFENWSSYFEDLQELTMALGKIENQMYRLLAENTGKSEEEIRQALKKELWLTAKEAVNFGLADEILSKGGLGIKVKEEETAAPEKKKEKSSVTPPASPHQNLR